jgi:hypothetical protein
VGVLISRLAVLMFVLVGTASSVATERYLSGVRGPYSGRVVDAVSSQPLAKALAIVVWQSEDSEIDGMKNVVAIREVTTGIDGSFAVHAAFEATVPPRTLRPTVHVFAHGYIPSTQNPHGPGMPAEDFRGAGKTVALRPALGEEDRARAFNVLFAASRTWQGRGPAPNAPPQPPLLLLEQFFGEQLERLGFREQGGVWRPVPPR